jgi:cyclophilin family peptidyl-prolyl cis-trans isomerase
MANSGRNSNSSQFFITLDAMPHLDGKHVVFGAVTEGMEYVEAVAAAAAGGSGAFDAPSMRVAIEDCGQM